MDPSRYKDLTVSRGLTYHYYHVAPRTPARPYLVFLHGFPSTSWDWHKQVAFFEAAGYGLIVPDLLGYGGTAKPLDARAFAASLICRDVLDILDEEGVAKAVAIGHDWGSLITSRFANHHPHRFAAFAFVALGYVAPSPGATIERVFEAAKKAMGREFFGYWFFFAAPEAKDVIAAHWDSFMSAMWPSDVSASESIFHPLGAMKQYLLEDRKQPLGSFVTEEMKQAISRNLDYGKAIASPLHYYNAITENVQYEDDKAIPAAHYALAQPVFFAGALRDPVCVAAHWRAATAAHCARLTARDFDADHWIPWAAPDALNRELLAWLEGIEF